MAESFQGGRLVAQALAAEGVDTIFTLCGGHVMPIYEGCRLEGLRVVDVRHEQAAAHAAEAWGRIRRTCGVAVVTAGPGVTGTLTALANSRVAHTPLVILGGARPLAQAEQGALQELDQLALVKPLSKWTALCTTADRIPALVAAAFRHALSQPRGPAYLELPMDVLFDEAAPDEPPQSSRSEARAFGDPAQIMRAADLLAKAERPAVIAGSGIWWDGAWKQLRLFAENGRLPVFLQGSGRGALPPDHELLLQHARGTALAEADVVCVIGTTLDFRLRFGRLPVETKLVHVHSDHAELGRNRRPDAAVVADCGAALGILADAVKAPVGPAREAWLGRLRQEESAWRDEHSHELESSASPIHHYRLGVELDRVLGQDAIVIGDGGDVVAAVSRVLRVHRPGHWLDPGPFGCLGVGAPYALGVKAARPETTVVVVSGDGSFGLNGFEFETLTRLKLPVVFVVGNDAGWGEIRIPQVGLYGEEAQVATRLAPTRYDLLTEAFGGFGRHVERPEELADALASALAAGEPAIVDVSLDPEGMKGHPYRGM
ncbi:MAG: acetolactate synthase [Candidatus Rokuibacteriota bacterium]|nr:MAG: acetolactate synthase [Candidatus Rokubacteria bacterium]